VLVAARLQRLDASGTELFPHNGTAVATTGVADKLRKLEAHDSR
jgi:hypothetical protein